MTSLTLQCRFDIPMADYRDRDQFRRLMAEYMRLHLTGTPNLPLVCPLLVDVTLWVAGEPSADEGHGFPLNRSQLDHALTVAEEALHEVGVIDSNIYITDLFARKRYVTSRHPTSSIEISVHSLFAFDWETNQPLI
jgi:hypothetical protein